MAAAPGPAWHVLFCKTAPNDSIQSHLQTCLVLIPQKGALQRDPFWRGEHKTRNVIPSQKKKWKAKRLASFSVRTLATVFLVHTPDDPLTWRLLLEQLVRLPPRHLMHSIPTPFNRATLAALKEFKIESWDILRILFWPKNQFLGMHGCNVHY